MKAIVQDGYGSADALHYADIDVPEIGVEDVLVRVRAAGVDPGVWHMMTGRPYPLRLFGRGVRHPKVPVRGRDLSGVVQAVGAAVTRLRPGMAVYGVTRHGSFAEYAVSCESELFRKPDELSFAQAAAVPVSGVTALQGLRDVGHVQRGQQVLIIGAGGGVGCYAVQLARTFGAHVTAVCSTSKTELVRSLGAEDVIDYTREQVDARGPRFDLILDTVGRQPVPVLRRVLTRHGTLAIVGDSWLGGFGPHNLLASYRSAFSQQRLRIVVAKQRFEDLEFLTDLIEVGRLVPVIDRIYPLLEAADAIRYLAQGNVAGNVVVSM